MEAFSGVTDTDGKRVGPSFKTMKSEFVTWQESIRTKNMIYMCKVSWMKRDRFCLTTCHGSRKKLCPVMTSVSSCDHMWNIEGWIHNKRRNRLE